MFVCSCPSVNLARAKLERSLGRYEDFQLCLESLVYFINPIVLHTNSKLCIYNKYFLFFFIPVNYLSHRRTIFRKWIRMTMLKEVLNILLTLILPRNGWKTEDRTSYFFLLFVGLDIFRCGSISINDLFPHSLSS